MKSLSTAILVTGMSLNSLSIVAQEAFISPKLEKIWISPDGLNVPE